MDKKVCWWFILIIVLTASALALNNHPYQLKLLAVQESEKGYEGSDADLYLELKEGSGRVFLDTYPLTQMDTQISTRFAKEIACKHFQLNCAQYDFIYTIKARSNIIGGPSAGAAIAALTTIAVLDLNYDKSVAVTGTVNSGGTIGPVGGVKEKLEAASKAKLQKVLIPKGTAKQKLQPLTKTKITNETNTTKAEKINESQTKVDLKEYGEENLSLKVEEVMDLDEVILALTRKDPNHKNVTLVEDVKYQEIMKGLQQLLCERTNKLQTEIVQEGIKINETVLESVEQKQSSFQNASQKGDYYSAASFCFSNNILLRTYYYEEKKPSGAVLRSLFNTLDRKTKALEQKLTEEKIETIADLQARMVVKERLEDAQEQINLFNQKKEGQKPEDFYGLLAYAEERYFSALSWTQFFSMEGKKFLVDKERLQDSCLQKISESEERHQYASFFLGDLLVLNIRDKIVLAKRAVEQEEFELCLMEASQAKAEANAILSSLGLSEENFASFLESKRKAVERVISENSAEGIFPILGYSYYQYAQSLEASDKYVALVYYEYALEMSDLSIYFLEEKKVEEKKFGVSKEGILLGEGFLVGVILTLLIFFIKKTWFRKTPQLNFIKKNSKNHK